MLTKRYLASIKNIPAIMQKIIDGSAPSRFTNEHLKNIGFGGSNDRGIIPLLKDLGFLSADGEPTTRYHEYRNPAKSRKILGQALKETYEPLFHINVKPSKTDKNNIEGIFRSTHNVEERVAEQQAATFFALLNLAELPDENIFTNRVNEILQVAESQTNRVTEKSDSQPPSTLSLRYNIEVHLPATKDIEVYNAIFKSLRDNLGD